MKLSAALLSAAFVASFAHCSTSMGARVSETETVAQANTVLQQIMAIPASGIPAQLLSKAQAVAIVPQVKGGAFVVGIRRGRGVLLARDAQGTWQAPQFIELTGGSVGWQAGIQSTDVVLVFQSRESLANLMSGKLTIGADASVAAGPVGRQASAATDFRLQSEIYSYSRSRGAFLGVSIDGSVLKPDPQADAQYYQSAAIGQPVGTLPAGAQQLVSLLTAYSTGEVPPMSGSATAPGDVAAGSPSPVPGGTLPQEIAAAWQALQPRLDPTWQAFLAPPQSAFTAAAFTAAPSVTAGSQQLLAPEQVGARQELQQCLQRYQSVMAQPAYAGLAAQPEFQAVYAGLVRLNNLQATPAPAQWQLPPPPIDAAGSR